MHLGGSKLYLIPSNPANKRHAKTRYGFELGSGDLSSILVPSSLADGTLISGLLFLADHAMYTGAS